MRCTFCCISSHCLKQKM